MQYDVLTPGGEPAGRLDIYASGVRTGFAYISDRPFPLSRLVLLTESGPLSLGIPAPEAGGMSLRKLLSPLALGGADLGGRVLPLLVPADADLSSLSLPAPAPEPEQPSPPPEPEPEPEPSPGREPEPECPAAPARQAPPEAITEALSEVWAPEPAPARLFADPELAAAAENAGGVLARADGPDTLAAFPFSPSKPFPLLPAFRFGAAQEIGGGTYLVFRLRDGRPI